MGVYIDMKIPKCCSECRFSNDSWCYAFPLNVKQPERLNYKSIPSWCPIRKVSNNKSEDKCQMNYMEVISKLNYVVGRIEGVSNGIESQYIRKYIEETCAILKDVISDVTVASKEDY